MARVKVESFVYFEHEKQDYVLPHKHDLFELVYYLSGNGEVNYLGEKHIYRAGTVSLVEPQLRHDEMCFEPTDVFILTFSASMRAKLGNIFLRFDEKTGDEIASMLRRIGEEYRSDEAYGKRIADSMTEAVLYRILREAKQSRGPMFLEDCVESAKRYISEHSAENIDFAALAQEYGYSYHRFRHIFKEIADVTPLAYLSEQRLGKAKELLEKTELPVGEIAEKTGFSTLQYFINFFRTHVGTSPARYRHIFKLDNPIGVYRFK